MNELRAGLILLVVLLCTSLMLVAAHAADTQIATVKAGNPIDTPVSVTTTTTTKATFDDAAALRVEDSLASAFRGARDGNWRLLAGALLSVIMTIAYKLNVRQLPVFSGDRGGAILVMVLSLLGAAATALVSEQPINLQLILGAVGVAFTAVGGWTWIKRMIKPINATPPPVV